MSSIHQMKRIHWVGYLVETWIRVKGMKTNNMHQKGYKRIRWFCGLAVLLSLCVLLIFVNRHITIRPFKNLKSEEIKSVQVVNGMFGVIHDMTEVEIEELVDILVHVTHNEYARDFEIPVGGGLGERFVLEFHDGRTISVGGIEVWRDGCYIAIDLEPYHDWDGTYSRQLSSLHSEYYRKWREGQER